MSEALLGAVIGGAIAIITALVVALFSRNIH